LVVVPVLLLAAACGGNTPSTTSTGTASGNLAAKQQLRFPIIADISTLDPALVQSVQDNSMVEEVFGGLYQFDDNLKETPDIATGLPDISSDGLTYTFHLRKDAKFSNGDPVTSADVLYSWNRAARLNGQNGFIFKPIVGYSDVVPASAGAKPSAQTMSGLTAPDPETVVAKLTAPASYFISELGIAPADIVDQKEIPGDLDRKWSTDPSTAIGTGPFKLTAYVPKNHLSFANVASWWGGSTGHLTDVEVTVVSSSSSQVTSYQSGGLDEIGPANTRPPLDAVLQFEKSSSLKNQVVTVPGGSTTWIGFNMNSGPFAPDASAGISDPVSKAGRLAFSLSIDRNQLVNLICGEGGQTCKVGSGGVIPKGLQGYLGDGKDTSAAFDAATAKKELDTWDPTGTKRKGLTYWYYAQDVTKSVAENLQAQWQQNLGVHVNIQGVDFTTYLSTLEEKTHYMMFADFTQAFYDNPQEWFDSQFVCSQKGPGLGNLDGFCDQRIDAAVAQAKAQSGQQAITTFMTANQFMVDDATFAILYYGSNQYFVQPWVKGAGGNALNDNSWTNISILSH
jgi:oligopeptide transport system substrate-binding protein